jgi:hypothetical protein
MGAPIENRLHSSMLLRMAGMQYILLAKQSLCINSLTIVKQVAA